MMKIEIKTYKSCQFISWRKIFLKAVKFSHQMETTVFPPTCQTKVVRELRPKTLQAALRDLTDVVTRAKRKRRKAIL